MSEEGAAEKVYEAGLELVNPGGDPETLRAAADAWKALGAALDRFSMRMDTKVRGTLGSGWRGSAADAFEEHWREVKKSIEDAQSTFDDASKGLNKAADDIEEINEEIHQIYLEIGISVGISVGMSFLTMGFSAAVGAANAARLATEAASAAARLGRILAQVAQWFNRLKEGSSLAKGGYYAGRIGMAYGKEFGNSVATSTLSGNGPEWGNNAVGAGTAALGGWGAGAALGGRLGGGVAEDVTSSALGGAAGSVAGDGLNSAVPWASKDDEFDWSQSLIGAGASAVGGAAGAGASSHIGGGADGSAAPASDGGAGGTEGSHPSGGGGTAPGAGHQGGDPLGGAGGGAGSGSGEGVNDGSSSGGAGNDDGQQYVDAARKESVNSGIGNQVGVWGEGVKGQDESGDDVTEAQQKTAGQLRADRRNTSLANDFG